MKQFPTDQPLDEFESELRGLSPRAPKLDADSVLNAKPSLTAVDADEGDAPVHKTQKLNVVTWMASSWVCGATIGAAVMFVLLSSQSLEDDSLGATEVATEIADSSSNNAEQSYELAQNQMAGQSDLAYDWLDRIQNLPSGSLGVGSSLLIGQTGFSASRSEPIETVDSDMQGGEQLVDSATLKNQRQLLQELLDRPRNIF